MRSEQVSHSKISTLEEQVSRSQSLYAELDEGARVQIEKLRNEGTTDLTDIQKKYDAMIKKKDESLRTSISDVEQLKAQISTLKTEALERKADEEIRLNEKIKDLNQLKKQFQDAITNEQDSKVRQIQSHNERFNRLQEDMKAELDKQA